MEDASRNIDDSNMELFKQFAKMSKQAKRAAYRKNDEVNHGYRTAKIVEVIGKTPFGEIEYLIQYIDTEEAKKSKEVKYVSELEISLKSAAPRFYLDCECGVSKVYNERAKGWMHSSYCPKYRKL